MNRLVLAAAPLGACLLLIGCATVADAPVGAYAVGPSYSVTLGEHWSDVSHIALGRPKGVHLLTIDGPLLNRLYLTEPLADGDFIVKPKGGDKRTPTWRADFSPTEQVEFVADSVAALDFVKVETANLRPGGADGAGLRFDFTAKTGDGLDIAGTAMISRVGGRAFVIVYLAPAEHYFGASRTDVEGIMNSVRASRAIGRAAA